RRNGASERAISLSGLRESYNACPPVYTRAGRVGSPNSPLLPALYSKRIPWAVRSAGGPASTSQESKYPERGESTLTSRPLESARGVQSTRSSEVAMRMSGTLKYIQYFPCSAVAMIRFPATCPRMAPDLDSSSRHISPLASSARYSTYTFPSLTAAAGLNVANSSHRTTLSFTGERNVAAGLGVRTGLTCWGFSKGPNIQPGPWPHSGPSNDTHASAATAMRMRRL